VGCTLHFINQGIDTGGLIAHTMRELDKGDEELVLFWRGVRDSAEVYADFLQRFAAGQVFGRAQPAKGKLYQVKHRTATAERLVAQRVLCGYPDVELPQRVPWIASEPGKASVNK